MSIFWGCKFLHRELVGGNILFSSEYCCQTTCARARTAHSSKTRCAAINVWEYAFGAFVRKTFLQKREWWNKLSLNLHLLLIPCLEVVPALLSLSDHLRRVSPVCFLLFHSPQVIVHAVDGFTLTLAQLRFIIRCVWMAVHERKLRKCESNH